MNSSQLVFGIHSNGITSFLGLTFQIQIQSIQIGTIRDQFLLTGVQVRAQKLAYFTDTDRPFNVFGSAGDITLFVSVCER